VPGFLDREIHQLVCTQIVLHCCTNQGCSINQGNTVHTCYGHILFQVSCVINYDVPVYMKTYLHRVGRTARAGEHGIAYTILRPQEVFISLLSILVTMHRLKLTFITRLSLNNFKVKFTLQEY